jgi:hypothetical protein
LKTYVYQGARPRTMGSSLFGEQHEWVMRELSEMITKKGDRIGSRPIKSITPRGADKIYDRLTLGPKGPRLRTAEKIVLSVAKLGGSCIDFYQEEFNKDVPNPWPGVTMTTRVKLTKPAATREQVYMFAHSCIERGEVECGAVAVICFEWLQRPDNVVAGHMPYQVDRLPYRPEKAARRRAFNRISDRPDKA